MSKPYRPWIASLAVAACLLGAPASAAEPLPASLLLEQGKLARYPTPPEGPAKWGLTANDFSLLPDDQLVAKAGLPARREQIQVAAQLGDAYAQYVFGTWILLGGTAFTHHDGDRMLSAAEKQGLVRAVTRANFVFAMMPNADGAARLARLRDMAATGNAFSTFVYGMVLARRATSDAERVEARKQLTRAAELGYVPAQQILAEQARAEAASK